MTPYKPKLIEVALPLAVINEAAAKEKTVRHGHPAGIHHWWARRPLAAARAVIWASLVDDPSADAALTVKEQDEERQRLFGILERLVKWNGAHDPAVLIEAKVEIDRCFPDGPPAVLDPFGGGGAIPLEAQRLGLQALSGDLNPVAVLIQKSIVEIPCRFAGQPPVSAQDEAGLSTWRDAQGLAADVEAYGQWMRGEAARRIGSVYPPVRGPRNEDLTPIAWIWARTVESPDPAWKGRVPLVKSWVVAKGRGKPVTWVEAVVDRASRKISYQVRTGGTPPEGTVPPGRGGGGARCLATGSLITWDYIREESRAGRLGADLIAVAAEGQRGRVYVSPTDVDVAAAEEAEADSAMSISGALFDLPGRINVVRYGLDEFSKLFTKRQLLALSTFSDLLQEVHGRVMSDAASAGLSVDVRPFRDGGAGATAYADAVVTYLAFAIDKLADLGNSLARWEPVAQCPRQLFGRQAIPMVWDFAEANPFSASSGSFLTCLRGTIRALLGIGPVLGPEGKVEQRDAIARVRDAPAVIVSTDPPYYDNVTYADLSDFFYVWLRRGLGEIWPDECATLLTPKADELIANRYRAGSKRAAEEHFESGMARLMARVAESQRSDIPATVYYAYKATEVTAEAVRSTGWDTFLQAVLDSGLQVTATWPLRTETAGRLIAQSTNALASSIVLACRRRSIDAPLASRGEFIAALREELPEAVRVLQSGNIAPVDMAQSTIGPGIKVFSRYAKVVEADGSAMSVSDALAIINDVLGEVLDGEEAELDADTRFAATWYAQQGYNPGKSGDADSQARAKNTSLSGIEAAGIGEARGGSFRLFERSELDPEWDVVADARLTVWEATQHLVAALERSETEAAALLHRLGGYGDRARQLAYVLFQKATDKGWAEEAGAYNGLILAWPTLQSMGSGTDHDQQQKLL